MRQLIKYVILLTTVKANFAMMKFTDPLLHIFATVLASLRIGGVGKLIHLVLV